MILRPMVRFMFVPVMLIGVNGLAYAIIVNDLPYIWIAPVLVLALALTFASERIAPKHSEWNHDQHDTRTTIIHALIYEYNNVVGVLLIPLIVWLSPSLDLWPTSWPLLLQLLIAVVVADFAFTMVHMLSHKYQLLWRLHAVHHGVTRLYGFNGLVRHPLHQMLDMVIGTLPLVVIGMPTDVAILLGLVIAVQLFVQHANVDIHLGPFRNHLSIGELHHLHHVNWGTEGDCNFGLFFTVWDRLMGTFNPNPSRRIQSSDMGLDEIPRLPETYIGQLLFPLYYKPGLGAAAQDRRAVGQIEAGE